MITINVTQEDIDKGIKKSCRDCPISLAITRHVNLASVFVWGSYAIIGRDEIQLPVAAEEFIFAFDQGLPVKPFTFELNYTP